MIFQNLFKDVFDDKFLNLMTLLGLTVPVMAAGASGLDAKGADAYYDKLADYIDKSSYAFGSYVAFADLRDMDGDKVPEMIVVTVPRDSGMSDQCATVDIWQLKNGSAVKGNSAEFLANQNDMMCYATQNGKVYLHIQSFFSRQGVFGDFSDYLGTDGFHEFLSNDGDYNTGENEYYRIPNGSTQAIEIIGQQFEQYRNSYKDETDYFISGGGASWYVEKKNDASCEAVRRQLAAKAAEVSVNTPAVPAAGTYEPYSIRVDAGDFGNYMVYFDAAKVEQKTVQVRHRGMDPADVSPYESEQAILITVRPNSNISIRDIDWSKELAQAEGYTTDPWTASARGTVDGMDRFTMQGTGYPIEGLRNGQVERSIKNNVIIVLSHHSPKCWIEPRRGQVWGKATQARSGG